MVYFELNDESEWINDDGNTFIGSIYSQNKTFMKYGMDISRNTNPTVTIYPTRLRFYDHAWIDIEVSV